MKRLFENRTAGSSLLRGSRFARGFFNPHARRVVTKAPDTATEDGMAVKTSTTWVESSGRSGRAAGFTKPGNALDDETALRGTGRQAAPEGVAL